MLDLGGTLIFQTQNTQALIDLGFEFRIMFQQVTGLT